MRTKEKNYQTKSKHKDRYEHGEEQEDSCWQHILTTLYQIWLFCTQKSYKSCAYPRHFATLIFGKTNKNTK